MSDSLLQRVAGGDVAAIQACIDRYSGLVWSLARRLCSPADAEDAVQEVFITLWEKAATFDESKGAEVTFVSMIARRRLIDRMRRRGRQDRLVDEVKTQLESDASRSRDEVSIKDQARAALEAVEQLSESQQRVLRLAVHHGLTHEQIAAHTQMPLGTVKTHVRRGLMRVRELLSSAQTVEVQP